MTIYPLSAVRTMALVSQGLVKANASDTRPGLEMIQGTVEKLGCVQIDTLNLVRRSHYLVLWSRLGNYDPADFDRLVYSTETRRLFEGWQRIASFIPIQDYRFQIPHQRRLKQDPSEGYTRWFDQEGMPLMDAVLERIRQDGALRAADFEYEGPKRGSWWDWKPAKTALEYLYAFGELMISNRVNFQRVYDLTERVLPGWVDVAPPSLQERDRYWLEQAALALGIARPMQVIGYSYYKKGGLKPILQGLVDDGVLVEVLAEQVDGSAQPMLVHRDRMETLDQIAGGALCAERTTFLSPFDNLFWAYGRDEQVWGFRQRLEAYLPAAKRTWGYFCLPILHKDRFVGRFDPKLERKAGLLRIKALYLEEGVALEEELVSGVAEAMRDFMRFHEAKELVIERSQPGEFGERVLQAV